MTSDDCKKHRKYQRQGDVKNISRRVLHGRDDSLVGLDCLMESAVIILRECLFLSHINGDTTNCYSHDSTQNDGILVFLSPFSRQAIKRRLT